jgi:hypothetical protein
MRRFAIRLVIVLVLLLAVSQFVIPPLVARHTEKQLTAGGGTADVHVSGFPAFMLLFGHGHSLNVSADRLSVPLDGSQQDAFNRLDGFAHVAIHITNSTAGPVTIANLRIQRIGSHLYGVSILGRSAPGDVARYAGGALGGSLGAAIGGLAASALGNLDHPLPFDAHLGIDTTGGVPRARDAVGTVAGLPAGPLAQIVANALLTAI